MFLRGHAGVILQTIVIWKKGLYDGHMLLDSKYQIEKL